MSLGRRGAFSDFALKKINANQLLTALNSDGHERISDDERDIS